MASPEPISGHDVSRPRRAILARAGAITLLAALLGFASWQLVTWPDVAALAAGDPPPTAFMQRWQQRQRDAGHPTELAWRPVPYGRLSPRLKRAVLVAEDIDFFSHRGFATEEMRAAWEEALRGGRMRGASTITQQLAKNLWLAPSRNPWRKVKEAILTWQLERTLDKHRILELYINVVEFGPGLYGAEAAARRYYGCSAASLSEQQAAELAAALPRPGSWHPGVSSRGYRRAVERILGRMEKATWIENLL